MRDLSGNGRRPEVRIPSGTAVTRTAAKSISPETAAIPARAACALLLVATLLGNVPVSAQEPYRYYGGDVEAREKNAAIEACEYEELVEKQRCNRSLNKNACIDGIRRECYERFRTDEPPEPPPEPPR